MKIALINLVACLVVLFAFSFLLRSIQSDETSSQRWADGVDPSTIRATFPNYQDMDPELARAIFQTPPGKPTEYEPFTGWRRTPFDNGAITIEDSYNTRLSIGHQINGSVWFLGGSTMWGTGATNETTIPSYFAKITGNQVWNLGESGYNSFQELIRVQKMLMRGLKPKAVIFYDGVNDSNYCNRNANDFPLHSRVDQHARAIEQFRRVENLLKEARAELNAAKTRGSFNILDSVLVPINYIAAPFLKAFRKLTDERAVGGEVSSRLTTETPFSEFVRKNHYKVCGDDPQRASLAAAATVETWFLAHDLLHARGIPSYYFLQPTGQVHSDKYRLDHILDVQKQRIADERSSHEARYRQIVKYWRENCETHGACSRFFDISAVLIKSSEPVFIDAFHLSPQGNAIVAGEIARSLDGQ